MHSIYEGLGTSLLASRQYEAESVGDGDFLDLIIEDLLELVACDALRGSLRPERHPLVSGLMV